MKVIVYSLFGDTNSFEYPFYERGCYFNARMNRLLYPDWVTIIHTTQSTYDEGERISPILKNRTRFDIAENVDRCHGMLFRMKEIFDENVTHVLCRDADAITTYREAACVKQWLDSGLPFHGINDNPAHGGLMGGMVGFRTKEFKETTGYTSFDQMISGLDLRQHGSDQNFMMKSIHPKIKNQLLMHVLAGGGCEAKQTIGPTGAFFAAIANPDIGIDKRLWESNLTCRFIGSPGVVDFELLRFFKRFDPNPEFDKFEKQFPQTFYWQR